jgi:transcriptional regulator GlxA family with amidase domain
MKRRNFLAAGLSAGFTLPAALRAAEHSQSNPTRAIAEGAALKPPADKPIQVAVAVSAGTTWIDFVGPEAVFETWHFDPVAKKHKPRFKVFYVSENIEPVSHLVPDYTFENAPPAQIVLVPAQSGSPALLEWLRKTAGQTDVTMSVCTGARHLAKAGLLDGKQATSHHKAIDELTKNFPAVKWISGMRFVEGNKISTGGGLTAGIDLALRVTERYFDRQWALEVADHLEYQGKGWIV